VLSARTAAASSRAVHPPTTEREGVREREGVCERQRERGCVRERERVGVGVEGRVISAHSCRIVSGRASTYDRERGCERESGCV